MHTFTVQGAGVPALGLGTWLLTGQDCVDAVALALRLGYRHIDTAQLYQNEAQVGLGLRQSGVPREEVFLVTKVHPSRFRYEDTLASARESLERLGTDYVDLLLMHWPNPEVPLQETLSALVELQRQGKARFIGVSNFSPSLVEEASRHAPVFCNQVEFHPYLERSALLAQARGMGYLLTAHSPLARGRVARDPLLQDIGRRCGKSAVQVCLRWLLQQGVSPIPKAGREAHLRENLEVFDFSLSPEDMRAIHGLARGLAVDEVTPWSLRP